MSVATRDLVTTIQQRHKQRWTLRFKDDAVEAEYVAVIHKRINPIMAWPCLLAGIVHRAFGILDYLVSEVFIQLWLIRYFIGFPMIIIGYLLITSRRYYRYYQGYISLILIILSCSIIGMVAIGDYYVANHYYTGVIIIMLFGAILFFIRYIYLSLISVGVLGLYALVSLHNPLIETSSLINSYFFCYVP